MHVHAHVNFTDRPTTEGRYAAVPPQTHALRGRPAVHEITTCTRVARVSVVARPRSGFFWWAGGTPRRSSSLPKGGRKLLAANPNVQATSSVNLESRILAVFAGRILHRTLGERNARVARRQNKHDFARMRA